jgi:hypothetical protein
VRRKRVGRGGRQVTSGTKVGYFCGLPWNLRSYVSSRLVSSASKLIHRETELAGMGTLWRSVKEDVWVRGRRGWR